MGTLTRARRSVAPLDLRQINTSTTGGHHHEHNRTARRLRSDEKLDTQRDIIRQSLDAIANDIGMAMRDVGLTFPLYITVRNSGDALVTIATPLDPSDTDWQQASAIVCRTLEERVGCGRLRGRELACAIANAGSINAADVTAD